MKNVESQFGPENREVSSEIKLHFFRHGEQFKDPNKPDIEYELSPAGREQGMKKAKTATEKPNLRQTMAFGSPRKRSQQTASFAMAGEALDNIVGNESLEELKKKLDKDISYGSKVMSDSRLDFFMDKSTPFGKVAFDAFATKKQYMKFLVEESDKLAEELNDEKGSTYSRQARDIAEIVKKYITVSDRWSELVQSGKYQDPKLERFLGSHGGVTESFLFKVIEKTKGVEERNKLLALIPNIFDFTEGFDVELVTYGGDNKPAVRIIYEKQLPDGKKFEFNEVIPIEVVEEIIKEGQ